MADMKTIINTLYDGGVLTALTIANSIVLDKTLKMGPESPKGSMSIKKFSTLALAVSGAVFIKKLLQEKAILPVDPYK